eukprot:CAMPEP_0183747020 /NCGR_PEP_ID=MMETSP0737-20130205/67051_1 /TAXON_ID=385413 /ORGANISM="Thalassiosira miniscula, Strain CCMP1093" /LENGTH=447 /DNA_ID=CAMNT_0025982727 /DNA_START=154 /DNA_END=1497 /DNA_ORIENTATION=+
MYWYWKIVAMSLWVIVPVAITLLKFSGTDRNESSLHSPRMHTLDEAALYDFDLNWPMLKDKMCPNKRPNEDMWEDLFKFARIQLNLSKDVSETHNFIRNFFTFSSGGVAFNSKNNVDNLIYLRVWKCGNEHLTVNLKETLREEGSKLSYANQLKKDTLFDSIPQNQLGQTCIVTAVRDPIDHFMSGSSGGVAFNSKDNVDNFVYLRVWKCGNDHIVFNLRETLPDEGSEFSNVKNGKRGTLFDSIPQNQLGQTCIVTAVRDPIDHFMSGYNEMEFRDHERNVKYDKRYAKYSNGTATRFEEFVVDFIDGELGAYGSIKHTFSMTGILWYLDSLKEHLDGFSPELTGYLPSLADLDNKFPEFLGKTCNGLPDKATKEPFPLKTHHDSQADQFGFHTSARKVWNKNGPHARALCAIHAMDYACYDALPVPPTCKSVFGSQKFVDYLSEK